VNRDAARAPAPGGDRSGWPTQFPAAIRSQLEAVTPGSAQCRFVVLTRDFADWSSGLYPPVAACCLSFVVRMWSGRGRTRCIVWRREGERLRVRPRMVGRLEGSSVKGGWRLVPGVHQWPSTNSYSPASMPICCRFGAGLPQRDLRVMSPLHSISLIRGNAQKRSPRLGFRYSTSLVGLHHFAASRGLCAACTSRGRQRDIHWSRILGKPWRGISCMSA
jgi:hypothetical protein